MPMERPGGLNGPGMWRGGPGGPPPPPYHRPWDGPGYRRGSCLSGCLMPFIFLGILIAIVVSLF